MNLKNKSVWIFSLLVILLVLSGFFPNTFFISAAILVGMILVLYQAYTILKENKKDGKEGDYKVP